MRRYLMIGGGFLSLLLGTLGIFLPLLPTTPFLLLSASLFSKSSEKFHRKLMGNKILGEYIYNYSEKKGLKRREKIISLGTLWGGILFSFMKISNVHGRIFLLVVLAGVTYHLLKLKTLKN
ncbi:YbaN family protein [Psychrilyobacter atlanticus]|uniref:YbaN family protein n=1 Tax=Psychrilyobacter atlanticus TaxID=271091 RepID=UPI00040A294F|nr:YbaN family protein [Psychrilyobacter atlanticus]